MDVSIGDCTICGKSEWSVSYAGPVRAGQAGSYADGTVYRCAGCGVEYLPPEREDVLEQYRTGTYRRAVGELPEADDYFRVHDSQQLRRLGLLEDILRRGQTVADIGCGGGSFLDLASGYASATIAIDPAEFYHDSLRQRGHTVYGDTADALLDWEGRVDLVVSFSVVEHVEDPVGLLSQARRLLRSGGVLLISTPNRRDLLLEAGPEAYRSFFYRTAHTYYFDEDSLAQTLTRAGFSSFRAAYSHRFGFGNFLNWISSGHPTGNAPGPLDEPFDRLWALELERRGRADYLYMFGRP